MQTGWEPSIHENQDAAVVIAYAKQLEWQLAAKEAECERLRTTLQSYRDAYDRGLAIIEKGSYSINRKTLEIESAAGGEEGE
jgi:hypothetical protein